MATPDLLELFVRPLHRAGVRYMVSGSLASIHYGEPRLTMDVDVVIHLDEEQVDSLTELFPEPDFYLPPPDVIVAELRRATRGHFNAIHLETGQKADFYPSRQHPYWAWAWEHRRSGEIGGQAVWFAPPEYVILWKLEFFREGAGEKHLRDIRGMLRESGARIDRRMLDHACDELGLHAFWQKAQET